LEGPVALPEQNADVPGGCAHVELTNGKVRLAVAIEISHGD